MKYFKSKTGEVYGYDETYSNDLPSINAAISNGWEDVTETWPQTVAGVVDPIVQALSVCKTTAKQKLLDTDYTDLVTVSTLIENKVEFDEYRAAIRNLYLNPVENPVWPTEPTPIWKSSQ